MLSARSSKSSPISVSTSQAWDSDGAGEWSTFIVEIGSPAQPTRVLISTTSGETWVVLPEGCPSQYGSTCEAERGLEYIPDNSTTWDPIGLYELDLELNLGLDGNASYGHDTVALGYPGSNGPELKSMVVAGIASPDFWLGHFGIDPAPSNFSTLNDPQPSFLETLANNSLIPSISWAYTAGASYRYDKVPGSLTLGGYDKSRFTPNDVSFRLYDDVARRLIVDLTLVTVSDNSSSGAALMSETIPIFIDSTVPYIYLPVAACEQFETTFGLQWNETTEIYTIDSEAHTTLQAMDPNITFTLANTMGKTLNISLPYKAFNLTATFPVVEDSTNYFPLKRAANDTQYTLGRVFLQEAYVISDFERSTFSVSQCVWPATFHEDIVAILPPSSTKHTPTGIIAGGVVGGIVVIIVVVLLVFFIYMPRRKNKTASTTELKIEVLDPTINKPELDARENPAHFSRIELDSKKHTSEYHEIHGQPMIGHEMASPEPVRSELESRQVFEMPAREPVGTSPPISDTAQEVRGTILRKSSE